ncbi:DUF1273 domain-containing protein [Paenibacillus anaericanus]|uniref:DUF1273 domain-containing protein n=1 Tax=Paenibacillus anaericanus TaxID=170367 RepID=A0A3S1C5W4_9BACL|nr:DUF1273 domain-containing protein [Paenibacillus anaericanus]RUT43761.1 DUF1273 domain-containing protein [Paenibacillus anaericanus]
MKNLLVTGYRAHELGIYDNKHKGIPYIRQAIAARLIPLVEEGLEWVITPGQYGVDLWACEAAMSLKPQFPHLKCSIITAFSNQEEKWKDEKKSYYQDIIQRVDYYGAVSKEAYIGKWQFLARDELLFRKTDGILLVYDEESGEASPKYVKERALKKHESDGYIYLNIGMDDIQSIADEDHGPEFME